MIVGVIDISFLASPDFKTFMNNTTGISFVMYSPLAWQLGYRRPWIGRIPIDPVVARSFLENRFKYSEKAHTGLLMDNLNEALKNGRISLIRNEFFRYYRKIGDIIPSSDYRPLPTLDICNILLTNSLGLPIWAESGADKFLQENYRFKEVERSDVVSIPLGNENPNYTLKDALNELALLANKRAQLDLIYSKLKEALARKVKTAYVVKGIVLSSFEPMSIWERLGMGMESRLLLSAFLMIIDVAGARKALSNSL